MTTLPSRTSARQRPRYWTWLGWTFIGLLAAFMLAADLGKVGVPDVPRVYIVRSGSMTPTFSIGSAVIDWPLTSHPRFHRGEIVTFEDSLQPGVLLTHRIIQVKHGLSSHQIFLVTKGDANPTPDPFITPANRVVGTYLFAVPDLGYIMAFLSERWLWLIEMLMLGGGIVGLLRWVGLGQKKEIHT